MTTVVDLASVSKRFVIRRDKSIKERLLNIGRSRQHREEFWALRDVELSIESGMTVGLVGANGSGKSTLLKLIGGIIEPTTGRIQRRGRVAALLELGAGFHPDLTGRENTYLNASILGLSREQTDQYFDSILEFSEIGDFIDTQVKFYSSGMYVRLAFSIAIHVDPDILLVDEVLAVGDEPFQRKCMEKIKEFQRDGRTIIVVSHSLGQVAELCDRVIVLEHGDLVFDGPTEQGIKVLRHGFAERESEHPRFTGNAPLKVTSVIVRTESSKPAGNVVEVRTGETLELRVRVASTRPIVGWMLAMSLETATGQGLFGVSTDELGTDLGTLDGECEIVFTLPLIPIARGDYQINLLLSTDAEGEVERLNGAARFEMSSAIPGHGVLPINATASMHRP